jgi:aquaporin Z
MKRYVAEAVGTFVLVFGGVGAMVLAGYYIGLVGVAFAFGLALLAMVFAIGPISGCHINPVVSVGFWVAGRMRARDLPGYMIAQVVGAMVAAALVLVIAKGTSAGYDPAVAGFAANGYGDYSPGGYSLLSCFIVEAVLTLFLVFTYLAATDARATAALAGIPIGLVLIVIQLIGIPVTNTSVNPARSMATAAFVGGWALTQLWLFIAAPLVGAVLAAILYRVLRPSQEQPS